MKWKGIFVFLVVYALFSLSGLLFPIDQQWYHTLNKPSWTPPGQTIGIIWVILYAMITLSLAILSVKFGLRKLKFHVIFLIGLNYFFNQAFSYLEFVKKNLFLSFVDTFFVAITCLLIVFSFFPVNKWSSILYIPYFLWSAFATFLAYQIYTLNL